MRHLTALQLTDGSGWRYGSAGQTGGHPIGYCAEHAPHATEHEARECYSRWQRDHVKLDGKTSNWTDCRECKGPTKQYARIEDDGYHLATLCAEHLTIDLAVKHLDLAGAAGDSWES